MLSALGRSPGGTPFSRRRATLRIKPYLALLVRVQRANHRAIDSRSLGAPAPEPSLSEKSIAYAPESVPQAYLYLPIAACTTPVI